MEARGSPTRRQQIIEAISRGMGFAGLFCYWQRSADGSTVPLSPRSTAPVVPVRLLAPARPPPSASLEPSMHRGAPRLTLPAPAVRQMLVGFAIVPRVKAKHRAALPRRMPENSPSSRQLGTAAGPLVRAPAPVHRLLPSHRIRTAEDIQRVGACLPPN